MTHYHIYLTPTEITVIKTLLERQMIINLQRGQTVLEPPNKAAAWGYLDALAHEKGLATLPEGQHYGLTDDGELISA